MRSLLSTLCAVALCAGTLAAQQLEVNDAAGSLTSNGANPTVGTPFQLGPGDILGAEVGGNAGAGYILVLGQLAAVSTPVPGGEWFDLDINGPLTVIVDGINGGGALYPFVAGVLNPNGEAAFGFPMSAANVGQTYAMQAVTFDPTSMFNLNFTAAALWDIVNQTLLASFGATLTDEAINVALPAPFTFYGQLVTQMKVTTKGMVDFDGSVGVDWSPTTAEMDNGTSAASVSSPMIAALWDDLETSGGGIINVFQQGATAYTVVWNQARQAFGGPAVGTFSFTVDFAAGVIVTIDHTGLLAAPGVIAPIVGITSGDVTAGVSMVNQVDLASAGAVNPFVPGGVVVKETIYQGFSGITAPVEALDTMGLVMTFLDGSGSGTDGTFLLF